MLKIKVATISAYTAKYIYYFNITYFNTLIKINMNKF